MRHFITSFVVLALTLALAACGQPDRKAADQKFLKACTAMIKHFYPPEDMIEVRESSFSDDKDGDGTKLRKVHVAAQYTRNRGFVENRTYDCWFTESRGIGGYHPSFYRIEFDGQRFGKFNGQVEGESTMIIEFQTITENELF